MYENVIRKSDFFRSKSKEEESDFCAFVVDIQIGIQISLLTIHEV